MPDRAAPRRADTGRRRLVALGPVLAVLALATVGLLLVPPSWAAAATEIATAGPLRLEADPQTTFRLGDGRRFVDTLELHGRGEETLLVNELGMDAYVMGVAEMPSRWPLEALKAQAVAARTYAWYSVELRNFDGYDICATTACQVFRGADVVLDGGERWRQAVEATAGEVLVVDDAPILARYFSTSGGRTFSNDEVFPSSGPRPYLVPVEDPDDAVSPYHRWTARFTREEFDVILARGDTLSAAVPVASVERLGDVDDQAAIIRVTGEDGHVVEVGARELRDFLGRIAPSSFPDRFPGARADGLRPLPTTVPSSRFLPEVTDDEIVLHGRGWGHGVGLGQYGALGRAERGQGYSDILGAYYGGLAPVVSSGLPERIRVGLSIGDEVTVRADGAYRILAGDAELVTRALGAWTARRDADGWLLTPPAGHDDELDVAATRPAPGALDTDDAVTVETEVNKPVLLRLEIRSDDGREILVRDLGAVEPGVHAATWRFDDADGTAVPGGDYLVTLVAEDAVGSAGGTPLEVSVPESERTDGEGFLADVRPALSLVMTAALVLGIVLVLVVAATRKEPT